MAENFANEYETTLAAAIDATQTSVGATSIDGSPDPNFRIRIDDEYMLVTAKAASATNMPAYGASGTGTALGTNTTTDVPFPAGITSGQRLILQVALYQVSAGSGSITTPSGWTVEFSDQFSGTSRRQMILSKVADGTESGTNLSVTTVNAYGWAHIHRYTDVATSGTWYEAADVQSGTVTCTHASIISTAANRLAIAMSGFADGNGLANIPEFSGETGGDWVRQSFFSSGLGLNGGIVMHSADLTSAGTLSGGSATVALTDTNWSTRSFALIGTDSGSPVLTVTRGIEGTTAAAHSSGAAVTHVLTAGGLTQAIADAVAAHVASLHP